MEPRDPEGEIAMETTAELHIEQDGLLIKLLIPYVATPFRPAVINADPDDCHPAGGGVELDGDPRVVSVEIVDEAELLCVCVDHADDLEDEARANYQYYREA